MLSCLGHFLAPHSLVEMKSIVTQLQALVAISPILHGLLAICQEFPVYATNCTAFPTICNNQCYAIFQASKPSRLNRHAQGEERRKQNRRDAGCARQSGPGTGATRNLCCNRREGDIPAHPPGQTSCDEYPYASTEEGGFGSIIRCTVAAQNTGEGRELGKFLVRECGEDPCTFDVTQMGDLSLT